MTPIAGLSADPPQALVLGDSRRALVRQLLLHGDGTPAEAWRHFLFACNRDLPPGFHTQVADGSLQVALGLTWRGLQMQDELPGHVRRIVRRLAPAFTEGAVARSAARLGDSGASAASGWLPAFAAPTLLGAFTLMHRDDAPVDAAEAVLRRHAATCGLRAHGLPDGRFLGAPPGQSGQWVHFGLRDGITRVDLGADGVSLGEVLLGEPRAAGDNPWRLAQAPEAVQRLFHHASFGALRMVEQDVEGFEDFVREAAVRLQAAWPAQAPAPGDWPGWVKSRLAGRWPDGRFSSSDDGLAPGGDALVGDPHGVACPFGSHVRRMNPHRAEGPTDSAPVHERLRVLVRCGRAYGRALWSSEPARPGEPPERGLMGHFFCASLEAQFEHLLGQWADRAPLGVPESGSAKDPLIGGHHDPRATLPIPLPGGHTLTLDGLRPFVRTRGTAYLLYLSKGGLHELLHNRDLVDAETLERRP